MTDSATSRRLHEWFFDATGRTFSRAQKLVLLAGIVLGAMVVLLIARLLGTPQIDWFAPSLVINSVPGLGLATMLLAVLIGAAAGTALTGRIRADAGIFCAAIALLTLRLSTGPNRLSLMYGGGRAALWAMAVELSVIGLSFVAAFVMLCLLVRRGVLPDDSQRDGAVLPSEKLDQKLLCTATTAVVMAVLMMLMCQSDAPGQAIWSVLISSWLATWCAFRFAAVGPSIWYWIAPIALGIVAYGWTAMNGSATAGIGMAGGMFAAMSRAAPLDYASVGVAGAIIGYWTGRRHLRDRAEREAEEPPPEEVTYSRG